MDNIDKEVYNLKPSVVGDGMEGEWKRLTIVIPELTFTHYEGSQYSPTYTGTAVTLDDFVPEDIQDAIVVNVLAYRRSYAGTRLYDIGCGYCSKVPTGKWAVTLYDKDISESEFTVFTVLDILYK